MASFDVTGIDELNAALAQLGDPPEDVLDKSLTAMAKVAAQKIKESGEARGVRDPESSVHILDKLKVGKFKKTSSGGYVDITFSGTRKNSRGGSRRPNARIAFENEYGNRHQQARPFVGPAMAQNEDQIVQPGAKILSDWADQVFK